MSERATWSLRGRNPDILTCIASLSNDEVFTPPEFANRMLDTLAEAWAESNNGANIWADSSVTFLDPCTKSGVFLREITRRLTEGLAREIPDLQKRVDHILTKQVFGIAITRLTALMARRSLYCSKHAKGAHSIARSFEHDRGNIWYERRDHTWGGNRCRHCGSPRSVLDRSAEQENYAYEFIHIEDIRARLTEQFGENMQFDVVVGNPPYQLASDGGTRDTPIYHLFVEQAKKLSPHVLMMVIPSRWMAGGLGLTTFRNTMLRDLRIREIVDYPVSKEVFPGVEVKGGICYFLWDSKHHGPARFTTVRDSVKSPDTLRRLDEHDILIRDRHGIAILAKVQALAEQSIVSILSADKEFGWTSNFNDFRTKSKNDDIPLYYNRKGKRRIGFVERKSVPKSQELIDVWKVMVPKAGSDGGQRIPDVVLGKPFVAESPSVCTQTYLFFTAKDMMSANSLLSYITTRFFRYLVSLRKMTQDATRSTYSWVPMQDWNREWTDEYLFSKYGFTEDEIRHIESVIRPMQIAGSEEF